MNSRPPLPSRESQQGVVLLESLIAILIFSLGVLGIVGLQAVMITSTTDAKFRSEASYIAQKKVGRMWADPLVPPADLDAVVTVDSVYADASDLSTLPGGTRTVTQPVAGQFVVRVGWTAPGEIAASILVAPCFMLVAHCFTTTASISGG